LKIEGKKGQDKEIEPITSDVRRDPSAQVGGLNSSSAGERNCDGEYRKRNKIRNLTLMVLIFTVPLGTVHR
jgi:hypothetical protein